MLEAEENIHWLKKNTHSRDLQDFVISSLSLHLCCMVKANGMQKGDTVHWVTCSIDYTSHSPNWASKWKSFEHLSTYLSSLSFLCAGLTIDLPAWHLFGLGSFLYCLASCKWLILNQCLRAQAPKTNCLVWVLTVPFTIYDILVK